ncbi:MAG: hypothetical protein IPJ81_16280 [Chitinophagaceae bacterium]|nr:hypothetical protein [Chitinophagaceae bacterium]
MVEVIIHINNRKVINMKEFREAFNQLKDGKHLVTVKDMRKRSIPQNAYYWGVVVPMVKKGLYDAGYDEVTTNEDAHEVMKHIHLRKRIVSKQTGDVIDISNSSAKLSIPEFNIYIEAICKWASEYLGIVIPSPNDQLIEFEQWQNSIVESCD